MQKNGFNGGSLFESLKEMNNPVERCGVCLKTSAKSPVLSKQQFWQSESVATSTNALVKCDRCSFLMCTNCYYNVSEPNGQQRYAQDLKSQCFQRCGDSNNLFAYYQTFKYEAQGLAFEPQSSNDILRRSFAKQTSQLALSNETDLTSLSCALLSRKEVNKLISGLSKLPVKIDLNQKTATVKLGVPDLVSTKEINLQYSIQLNNQTKEPWDFKIVHKHIKDYIRGKIEYYTTEYANQTQITLSTQQMQEVFKYVQRTQQIANHDTSQNKRDTRPLKCGPKQKQNQGQLSGVQRIALSIVRLGLTDQFRDLLQYALNGKPLVVYGLPEVEDSSQESEEEESMCPYGSIVDHLQEYDCSSKDKDYIYKDEQESQDEYMSDSGSGSGSESDSSFDTLYESLQLDQKRPKVTETLTSRLRSKCKIAQYSVDFKLIRQPSSILSTDLYSLIPTIVINMFY